MNFGNAPYSWRVSLFAALQSAHGVYVGDNGIVDMVDRELDFTSRAGFVTFYVLRGDFVDTMQFEQQMLRLSHEGRATALDSKNKLHVLEFSVNKPMRPEDIRL